MSVIQHAVHLVILDVGIFMNRPNYQVLAHEAGWQVVLTGSVEPESVHLTKEEAIDAASQLAQLSYGTVSFTGDVEKSMLDLSMAIFGPSPTTQRKNAMSDDIRVSFRGHILRFSCTSCGSAQPLDVTYLGYQGTPDPGFNFECPNCGVHATIKCEGSAWHRLPRYPDPDPQREMGPEDE